MPFDAPAHGNRSPPTRAMAIRSSSASFVDDIDDIVDGDDADQPAVLNRQPGPTQARTGGKSRATSSRSVSTGMTSISESMMSVMRIGRRERQHPAQRH
jgi:hypothetical protein